MANLTPLQYAFALAHDQLRLRMAKSSDHDTSFPFADEFKRYWMHSNDIVCRRRIKMYMVCVTVGGNGKSWIFMLQLGRSVYRRRSKYTDPEQWQKTGDTWVLYHLLIEARFEQKESYIKYMVLSNATYFLYFLTYWQITNSTNFFKFSYSSIKSCQSAFRCTPGSFPES